MVRIKEFRKLKHLSQQELSSYLGVTQATLSGWENGKYEMDHRTLIRCAELLGVTVDALLGNDNSSHGHTGVKIPVLGNVAAGVPISAVEYVLDYEEISSELSQTGEFFALRIAGNSMEPKISEGDIVVVKQQSSVDSGQIAIVLINGDDATCKKVVKHDNGISLISLNPAHPPMFFTYAEVEQKPVRVVGRVVELRAKL